MTSTSSEPVALRDLPVVLRDLPAEPAAPSAAGTDLRTGDWTRFGSAAVRGDRAAEAALVDLAERTRQAARAQGYALGWAEGRRVAQADAAAAATEHASLRDRQLAQESAAQRSTATALAAAADRAAEVVAQLQDELAGHTVELALQIAEAVIGRELTVATDPGADAIRRALAQVPPTVPVTVRLNPADRVVADTEPFGDRPLTLVDDPRLARGDAVVETEDGLVDATVAAALARVREVLQA